MNILSSTIIILLLHLATISAFQNATTRQKRQIGAALRHAIDDMKWKINDLGLKIDSYVVPKVQYAAEKIRDEVAPSITHSLKQATNQVIISAAQGIQKSAQFLSQQVAPAIEDTVVEISNRAVPVVNRGIDVVESSLQIGANVVSKTTSNGVKHIGHAVLGEQRHNRVKKIANNLSVNFNNSINSLAGAIKKATSDNDANSLTNTDKNTQYHNGQLYYPAQYINPYLPYYYNPYQAYYVNHYNNVNTLRAETSTELTVNKALETIVSNTAYSISNKILGPNLTDAVAPIARSVSNAIGQNLPTVSLGDEESQPRKPEKLRSCTTPEGRNGYCQDLSECPNLVMKLDVLRKSICFKRLFSPGICCPDVGQMQKLREAERVAAQKAAVKAQKQAQAQKLALQQQQQQQQQQLQQQQANQQQNQASFRPSQTTGFNSNFGAPGTKDASKLNHLTSKTSSFVNDKIARNNVVINKGFRNRDYKCGVPQVAQLRVVGGEESHIGEWPWTVAIYLHGPKKTEFWCGGSLISEDFVITAAHCTKDTNEKTFDPEQFSVHLGDYKILNEEDDRVSPPNIYRVRSINPHPEFKRHGYFNDIALIKLSRQVEFSEYILPVCLPPESIERSQLDALVGLTPTVIGYGSTYYDGPQSNSLRDVKLPIWKNSECDKAYFQPITDVFLCAGYEGGGKDACQGDSGGPLTLYHNSQWIQLGIVSFGNRCAEPGYPGVYTRISKFLPWIRDNLR